MSLCDCGKSTSCWDSFELHISSFDRISSSLLLHVNMCVRQIAYLVMNTLSTKNASKPLDVFVRVAGQPGVLHWWWCFVMWNNKHNCLSILQLSLQGLTLLYWPDCSLCPSLCLQLDSVCTHHGIHVQALISKSWQYNRKEHSRFCPQECHNRYQSCRTVWTWLGIWSCS